MINFYIFFSVKINIKMMQVILISNSIIYVVILYILI